MTNAIHQDDLLAYHNVVIAGYSITLILLELAVLCQSCSGSCKPSLCQLLISEFTLRTNFNEEAQKAAVRADLSVRNLRQISLNMCSLNVKIDEVVRHMCANG